MKRRRATRVLESRRAAQVSPRISAALAAAPPRERWLKVDDIISGAISVLRSAGRGAQGPWARKRSDCGVSCPRGRLAR